MSVLWGGQTASCKTLPLTTEQELEMYDQAQAMLANQEPLPFNPTQQKEWEKYVDSMQETEEYPHTRVLYYVPTWQIFLLEIACVLALAGVVGLILLAIEVRLRL